MLDGNPNETEAKSQEQTTTISNPISRPNMSYTGAPYSNMSSYGNYSPNTYSMYNNDFGASPFSNYSGYNSYGNRNMYSNNYSKPIPQGPGNQPMPPETMRQDVWGFLNGFQALLNVLYAGTGIVHFGKIFAKMTFKLIKAICGKSLNLIFKLTGFSFLKKLVQQFSTGNQDWLGEFNVQENQLQNAWGNNETSNSSNPTLFGKILLVLRITSLLGTFLALFLRRKAQNHQSPVIQVQVMDQEVTMMNLEQEAEKLNIEKEVKLVEIEDDDTPLSKLKNHLKDSIAETEAKPEQQTIGNNNENTTQDEIKVLSVSQTEETINITPSREETLIEPAENNFKIVTSEPNISTQEEVDNDNPKEQIVSEDFWKNKEVFKKIELYQQEEKQKTEEKKAFELPSVLKTLREKSGTASSNKPWLMKKKKAVEIQNVETPKEETKSEVKALEEVLETPNLSEETLAVNPEEITA